MNQWSQLQIDIYKNNILISREFVDPKNDINIEKPDIDLFVKANTWAGYTEYGPNWSTLYLKFDIYYRGNITKRNIGFGDSISVDDIRIDLKPDPIDLILEAVINR